MGLQQALSGSLQEKFTRFWEGLREFMGVSGRLWTVVYFFAKMVVLHGRCVILEPPGPTSRGSPGAPPGVHGFSPGGFRP